MAPPPAHLVERSLRHSAVRARLVLLAHRRGRLHAGHLAAAAGIDTRRLRWAMHGHRPPGGRPTKYRADLGLVTLGLFVEERCARSLVYYLSPLGRGWAATLAKRQAAVAWS